MSSIKRDQILAGPEDGANNVIIEGKNGDIYAARDVTVGRNLIVAGDITLTDDMTLESLTLTGDLVVGDDATVTGDLAVTATSTLTGTAYIGDTANADVTLGLTINQGAADDQILALKSSDVAHGVTLVAETDTYGAFMKNVATEGALRIVGLGEAQQGLKLYAIGTTADVTDAPTTSSEAICEINTALANSTDVQASGATGNIFQVQNNGTNEFIVKGDGELYSNQSATVGTFDVYNDAVLSWDLAHYLADDYEKIMEHSREQMIGTGIISEGICKITGKPYRMVSLTKMQQLLLCTAGQLYQRVQELTERLTAVEERKALPE